MENFFNQVIGYLNTGGIISVVIFAVLGLAFTYFGLKVYRTLAFMIGMFWGGALGFSGAAAAGWPDIGCAAASLLTGLVFGVLAFFFIALAVFLLGTLVGVMIASGFGEPIVLIIAGSVGGGVFVGLHQVGT